MPTVKKKQNKKMIQHEKKQQNWKNVHVEIKENFVNSYIIQEFVDQFWLKNISTLDTKVRVAIQC